MSTTPTNTRVRHWLHTVQSLQAQLAIAQRALGTAVMTALHPADHFTPDVLACLLPEDLEALAALSPLDGDPLLTQVLRYGEARAVWRDTILDYISDDTEGAAVTARAVRGLDTRVVGFQRTEDGRELVYFLTTGAVADADIVDLKQASAMTWYEEPTPNPGASTPTATCFAEPQPADDLLAGATFSTVALYGDLTAELPTADSVVTLPDADGPRVFFVTLTPAEEAGYTFGVMERGAENTDANGRFFLRPGSYPAIVETLALRAVAQAQATATNRP